MRPSLIAGRGCSLSAVAAGEMSRSPITSPFGGSWLVQSRRDLLHPIELVAVPKDDERAAGFEHGAARGVRLEFPVRSFDGYDRDAQLLVDPPFAEGLADEWAGRVQCDLLDLHLRIVGTRGQFDEIHDRRANDRLGESEAA